MLESGEGRGRDDSNNFKTYGKRRIKISSLVLRTLKNSPIPYADCCRTYFLVTSIQACYIFGISASVCSRSWNWLFPAVASHWGICWLVAAGHCVGLGFLFWVECDSPCPTPSIFSPYIYSSMSGTQILDLYFLLSSTDSIFPCVKEHFWYFRCMHIIWCSLLAPKFVLNQNLAGWISGFTKVIRCVVMIV